MSNSNIIRVETIITQLHPDHCVHDSVSGIYLREKLHRHRRTRSPLVYANFISSLDGRIAVFRDRVSRMPESLINNNDLRLFFELFAQADCAITHGAYLRAREAGLLGDVFTLCEELGRWRNRHRFPPLKVVVCSASLDFPPPHDIAKENLVIATGKDHDRKRAGRWRDRGYRLIVAGNHALVEADLLLKRLRKYRLRNVYLVAGPKLLESMLEKRCLDLLYLTLSHQLIGNDAFHTLIPGADTGHCRLRQKHLILDASKELSHPQWFTKFECRYAPAAGSRRRRGH